MIQMKRISLIIALIICILGCKDKSPLFTLDGEIQNLGNDTIFIYDQLENRGILDTIVAKNGVFTYSLSIDTITPLILLINKEIEYPVFADKYLKTTLQGDVKSGNSLQVIGGDYNNELTGFNQSIQSIKSKEQILTRVDSFIRNHPYSYANLYLIDKYFVQKDSLDLKRIKSLIKSMSGELQDKPYIKQLSDLTDLQSNSEIGNLLSSFSIKNAKGKLITFADFKDKYLLVNFWSTWDESSMKENIMFKRINKKFKKEKRFAMLGVSLDIDKDKWQKAIKSDTLSWEQSCDLASFDNVLAKQLGVEELPYNVLISPQKIIIAKNLNEKELINKLEEVLKEPINK